MPHATPDHPEALGDYVRAAGTRRTESEIRRDAVAAGWTQSQVDVALESIDGSDIDVGPIARKVLAAYLIVYAVLVVLVLANPENPGNGGSGEVLFEILVMALFLGGGFLVSLVWIANPRRFMFLTGVLLVIGGILGSQLWPMIGGVATAVASRRTSIDAALRGEGSEAAFMSMPLIILALLGASLYNFAFTRVV
jgi:hypothetical protein